MGTDCILAIIAISKKTKKGMDLSKDEGFKIVQMGKKTNAKPNKLIGEKVEKSVRRAISLLKGYILN